MSGTIVRTFENCLKCQQGLFSESYRLCVKPNVDSRSHLFHVHNDEGFIDILGGLCQAFPDIWKEDVVYYFYVDMGGFYHILESPRWLKDKDTLIVTTITDLELLPKINLAAVHAIFRSNVQLRPHQIEGVNDMLYMERAYRGGILADEMGLGKTIQSIAIVMKQQPVHSVFACTLIVVPSRGIADQWAEEIRTKTAYGSLPYFLYQDDSIGLLGQPCFRIVITTYDRVRSEYKRSAAITTTYEEAPLFDVEWFRIILDESHKVRGGTMLFHSVNALKAKYRWCLSGTPFQNDVAELYPIFTFLRIEMDLKKKREHDYMMELLRTHMIRRTKTTLQNELTMLPRQEKRIVLEFTKPERALYDYLERLLYHQLTRIKENGNGNSLLTTSAILYLRLKQVCGHHMILLDKFPDLIPLARAGNDKTLTADLGTTEVQREKNYYDETSEFEQALEIIESYYDQFGNLQEPIDLAQLQMLKFTKHSTKVKWVVKFLQDLLDADASEKIVVVSQFVDVIIKVGEVLGNTRIHFQTYHGGMSAYARKIALQKFNHDPKCRVLIMSLKAGGVGLNLQRANHMVIMDRWWNPATMDQAIARIHRMTQLKETFIHTVVIKDTIEESLMDNILNKKNELFQKIVERHEQRSDKAIEALTDVAIDNRIIDERVIERPVETVSNVKEVDRTPLNLPYEADEEEEAVVVEQAPVVEKATAVEMEAVVEEQRHDEDNFSDFEEELQEIIKNEKTYSLKQEEVARCLEDIEAENKKLEHQKKKKRRLFGIEEDNIITEKMRS